MNEEDVHGISRSHSPSHLILTRPHSVNVVATEAATTNNRHLAALDGVRGLAIIAVILHHCTIVTESSRSVDWLFHFAEFGAHGVDLFFVLSGFLITSQLLHGKPTGRKLGRFYLRRGLRIFPLYYAILLFVYLILPFMLGATGFSEKLATQTDYAGNWPWYIGFVSNFKNALDGRFTNPALDVSWSLAIEIQFYLFWPWVIRLCSRSVLKQLIWVVIVASPIIRAIALSLGANWVQILVLPFFRADVLLWGALLAIWWNDKNVGDASAALSLTRVRAILPWAACAILAVVLLGGWNRQNGFTATAGYSLVGLAAAGIFARVLTVPSTDPVRWFFERRFLVFMSIYSYGIYLVHLPIRAFLRDVVFSPVVFETWPIPPFTGQLVFYALAGVCSFLPAWVSWHYWEKPFIQWGHRKTASVSPPSP